MRWMRFLLGLCNHKWEIFATQTIVGQRDRPPQGTLFTLQCQHCGELKTKRTGA